MGESCKSLKVFTFIPVLTTWRGHIEHVTSIVLIEDNKLLMSGSLDCTVRLWTYDGEYVGMLIDYDVHNDVIMSKHVMKCTRHQKHDNDVVVSRVTSTCSQDNLTINLS